MSDIVKKLEDDIVLLNSNLKKLKFDYEQQRKIDVLRIKELEHGMMCIKNGKDSPCYIVDCLIPNNNLSLQDEFFVT